MTVTCDVCGPLDASCVQDIERHARSREHLEKNAEAIGLFVNELDASQLLIENGRMTAELLRQLDEANALLIRLAEQIERVSDGDETHGPLSANAAMQSYFAYRQRWT